MADHHPRRYNDAMPETSPAPGAEPARLSIRPTWIQSAWRRFCQVLAAVFYRRVEVRGLRHLPPRGPVILCANHVNALADGIVVQSTCPRPIHPLARSGLFRNPLLRPVLRAIRAIPIYRRRTGADEDVRSKNADSFRRIFETLAEGRVVLIFPEGQSHSDPMLRPLKTGAARLALGLREHMGTGEHDAEAQVVPVGLLFTRKGRFRSNVLVRYGKPLRIALRGGEDGEEAVRRGTEEIEHGLRQVTLNVDSWEDLRLLEALQNFFALRRGRRRRRSLAARTRALSRLVEAQRWLRFTHPDEMRLLEVQLVRFQTLCKQHGIRDDHLQIRYTPGRVLRFLLRAVGFTCCVFPLIVWGMLNSAIPYLLTRLMVRVTARGRDQYDTAGMLWGILFFGIFWSVQIFAVFWFHGVQPALLYGTSLPLTGGLALLVAKERQWIVEHVRVFLLFWRRRELQDYLKVKRQELEIALARMVRVARREMAES